MIQGGAIVADIERLLELFAERCDDRDTFDELLAMLRKPERWKLAHGLFQKIRKKCLAAEKANKEVAQAQYMFEEVCAKTIYNLSGESAPFDADSPYWIVPNAIALGRTIGVSESKVMAAVSLLRSRPTPNV